MSVIKFDPRRRGRARTRRGARAKRGRSSAWGRLGLVAAAVAFAYAVLEPAERFPEFTPWLTAATASRSIEGAATHVRDGDTIEVRGIAIRLASLDCPELGTDAGTAAKVGMQMLVAGFPLSCHLTGARSYDRWIGSCYRDDGQELGAAMIAARYCSRNW